MAKWRENVMKYRRRGLTYVKWSVNVWYERVGGLKLKLRNPIRRIEMAKYLYTITLPPTR